MLEGAIRKCRLSFDFIFLRVRWSCIELEQVTSVDDETRNECFCVTDSNRSLATSVFFYPRKKNTAKKRAAKVVKKLWKQIAFQRLEWVSWKNNHSPTLAGLFSLSLSLFSFLRRGRGKYVARQRERERKHIKQTMTLSLLVFFLLSLVRSSLSVFLSSAPNTASKAWTDDKETMEGNRQQHGKAFTFFARTDVSQCERCIGKFFATYTPWTSQTETRTEINHFHSNSLRSRPIKSFFVKEFPKKKNIDYVLRCDSFHRWYVPSLRLDLCRFRSMTWCSTHFRCQGHCLLFLISSAWANRMPRLIDNRSRRRGQYSLVQLLKWNWVFCWLIG